METQAQTASAQQALQPTKFKFELDIEEINAILLSLAKKPFEEVATLITKIHTAVKEQHEASQK